jgi:hypothetical protein
MAGRPALSDAEKIKRGTFDPRWSEKSRVERKIDKVVSLFGDAISVVPPAPKGLHEDTQREYQRWCRALLESGRLTVLWVEKITLLAMAKHNNLTRLSDGKMPRGEDMRAMKTILSELTGINADTPISTTGEQGRKFARFGFAGRVRSPQAG